MQQKRDWVKLNCPKCGSRLRSTPLGYQCCGRDCAFWVPCEIRQKVLAPGVVRQLVENRETRLLHGFHKRANTQTFSAKLWLDVDCKIRFRLTEDVRMVCPKCGKQVYRFDRGFKCVDEQKCDFVLWNTFAGKSLTEDQLQQLLTEGTTETIRGFVSRKNGKRFAARLTIGPQAKPKFLFENDPKQGSEERI